MDTKMQYPQCVTSFPNDNQKHIDYVITYKSENEGENHDEREFFLERLQDIDLIEIKRFKNGDHVYILLHCPLSRLFEEAEFIKLEMKLKEPLPADKTIPFKSTRIRDLKNFLLRKPDNKNNQEYDYLENRVSAPFEVSKKHLFEGCDENTNKNGPFSTRLRSLLVYYILNNLEKHPEDLRQNNLANMLHRGIFDDAFILHDDLKYRHHLVKMLDFIRYSKNKNDKNDNVQAITDHDSNARRILNDKWAKISNVFRVQPLATVRYYFGESVALYFGWVRVFIWTLILPTLIGIIFFLVGIIESAKNSDLLVNKTLNGSKSASEYGGYYLNLFADSFDNNLTPYYALIICLWGAVFSEFWKRENTRLAFKWDVLRFERNEKDLPEYTHKKLKEKKISEANFIIKIFFNYKIFKLLISYSVLLFMICIVCAEISAVVLYRIYIKLKVFPNDNVLATIVGDVGSALINTILILIMNKIYTVLAKIFTKFENYRTKTEYDDALIIKLFIFEFVNSYGPLFYLSFFRTIDYENGLFNLGKEYQDKCNQDNCMALLSIQLLIQLILTSLIPFLKNFILPLILKLIKKLFKKLMSKKVGTFRQNITQEEYIQRQKDKEKFENTIHQEYTQKVILYGYVVLFACSFSLGPLILLLSYIIDLRVDAYRLVKLFRRPVGFRAQDIGAWSSIIRFLNVVGIISNAFIIAFTSNWSKSFLNNSLEKRLIFVVVFEHVVFFIWFSIIILLPDVPRSVAERIRLKINHVKSIMNNQDRANTKQNLKQNLDNYPQLIETNTQDKVVSKQNLREKLDKYPELLEMDTQVRTSTKQNLMESLDQYPELSQPFDNDDNYDDDVFEKKEKIQYKIFTDRLNDGNSPIIQVSQSDANIINELYNEVNTNSTKRRKKNKKYSRLVANIPPKI